MKILILLALITNTAMAGFTFEEVWKIPDTQECDKWGYVSYLKQAAGILSLGESKKITVPIPSGAIDAFSSVKSHASEPSIVFTLNDYAGACYEYLAISCPSYQIPVAPNGIKDSLWPRYGSNPERRFMLNSTEKYLYWYQLNKIDSETGETQNVGASSLFGAVATFHLTDEACKIRAGITIDPPIEVPTCDDYKNAFVPLVMYPDLTFHINRITFKGLTYATDLEPIRNEDGSLYQVGTKIYFSMDLHSDTTYEVKHGILEDHDGDGASIVQGDVNDNNSDIR